MRRTNNWKVGARSLALAVETMPWPVAFQNLNTSVSTHEQDVR